MSDEEISPEEEQKAKDMLWGYFLTQYICGWSGTFPRSSAVGRNYMKKEHLEYLEKVGKAVARQKLIEDVNSGPAV